MGVVRDLASRVGPIVGSALACADISHSRIQVIADKFRAVIREVSINEAERDDISRLFDRYVNDGRGGIAAGRMDCKTADRQLTDLETSISGPSLASVIGPSSANAAPAPAASVVPPAPAAAQTTVAVATPAVDSLNSARRHAARCAASPTRKFASALLGRSPARRASSAVR